MKRLAYVTLFWIAGCSSVPSSNKPLVGETWVFIGVDSGSEIIRSTTLRFTDEPASSCIAGDWKSARVLTSIKNDRPAHAAYEFRGDKLIINLSPMACDNYEEMSGNLTWAGFSGRYYSYGLGWSKDLGRGFGSRAYLE